MAASFILRKQMYKTKEKIERKIDAVDTVLKIFEKDDPEEVEIKTKKVQTSKLSDEEIKLKKKNI